MYPKLPRRVLLRKSVVEVKLQLATEDSISKLVMQLYVVFTLDVYLQC